MIDRRKVRRHFFKSPAAVFAAFVILLLGTLAIGANWIAPHNPYDLTAFGLADRMKPPAWNRGEVYLSFSARTIRVGAFGVRSFSVCERRF